MPLYHFHIGLPDSPVAAHESFDLDQDRDAVALTSLVMNDHPGSVFVVVVRGDAVVTFRRRGD